MKKGILFACAICAGVSILGAKAALVRESLLVSRYHGALVGSDYVATISVVYGDIELVGGQMLVRRLSRDSGRKAKMFAWIKHSVWQKIESTPEIERWGERAYALKSTPELRAIYPEVTLEVVPSQFIMCEAHLAIRPVDREEDSQEEVCFKLP